MAAVASVMLCLALIAQQPTLRVDVDLANVSFTVQDENGAYQTHLTADDFLLLEDGVPQRIQFFSRELETPLTLAVVFDLSGSQGELIPADIEAAARFLKRILDPRDRALVVAFGPPPLMTFMTSRVRLISDLTPLSRCRRTGSAGRGDALPPIAQLGSKEPRRDFASAGCAVLHGE